MTGVVYVVPNLLGVVPPSHALPQRTIDIAQSLVHWIVETPKPARAILKALHVATPIASLDLRTFPTAPGAASLATLLAPAREGRDIGLLTDAGCPGVADPGATVVAAAHGARRCDLVDLQSLGIREQHHELRRILREAEKPVAVLEVDRKQRA